MISQLNILDTVEICVTDKNMQKHYYKTKIQDIDSEDTFSTMLPTSETGRPVLFFKDQPYELYAKTQGGIVLWVIRYICTERIDNLRSCKFQVLSGPQCTQRREFFRQPVNVASTFHLIKDGANMDQVQHEGKILDLSGGGCSFMCDDSLTLHALLFFQFTFRETVFEFHCEILDRIDYTESRAAWNYKYRVKWIQPDPKEVENLIKLVFAQQREMILSN
ncbi:flagellar brake protein [Aminipila luticellarii]|uniref:PilZ domain-containing protein n=1 Tax=Aminipila luticellarii TaxID=2507160 RepID=A0A410PSY4_9FIRM|nr:PilZ domain-containing protein [Aminipila luticellarii]QAT41978.1 hypothetical protein EQM06_01340 [Aminipila luticellarii]